MWSALFRDITIIKGKGVNTIMPDKITRDIRKTISAIGKRVGAYSSSGAKLFLATGKDIFTSTMPTVTDTYSTNRDVLHAAVQFFRKPSDSVNIAIGRATRTEDYNSIMKFVRNAVDDLKTGKLYDPDRDRSSAFTAMDGLMDSFGGFDMTGFDEDGNWSEPSTDFDSLEGEMAIAEVQEKNAAKRTSATIEAIASSTDAVTNVITAGTQTNIRMSMKQHAETLNTLNNSLSVQASTLKTIGEGITGILNVSREAHNQMMTEMQKTNSLLTEIRDQLKPASNQQARRGDLDVFSAGGGINLKNYIKNLIRNVDDKFGISSAKSMATGGMSLGMLADMSSDNPWQVILSPLIGRMIPQSLRKQMARTDTNIRNFLPALLTKMAGRAERKRNATGEASFVDEVISLLGVTPRSRTAIDTSIANATDRGLFSKKTATAIEVVIPTLLSQINSSISGNPLMVYDYTKGTFVKSTSVISQYTRKARDIVGSSSSVQEFMNMANAFKFRTSKDREEFQDFMYEYFHNKAESADPFINPFKDKNDFMDELPYHRNQDMYYKLMMGMFKAMDRSTIMQMSGDIYNAKMSRDRRNDQINQELKDNGLIAAFSGLVDSGTIDSIASRNMKKRFGLTERDLDSLVGKRQLEAVKRGGVHASNILLNDILGTLKKGIIVYSYNVADVSSEDSKSLISSVLSTANAQRDLEAAIRNHAGSYDGSVERRKAEDSERSARKRRNNRGTLNDVIVDDMTSEDIAAVIAASNEAASNNTSNYLANWFQKIDSDMHGKTSQVMKKTGIMSIFNKIQNAMSSPFGLLEEGLKAADAFMFKIIYGEDANTLLANGGEPSLMRGVTSAVQTHFKQAKDWFVSTIGDPIRKFLFDKEKGLFPKIRNFFDPMINNAKGAIKRRFDDVKSKVKSRFMGSEVTDEEGNTRYEGGVFSTTINRITGKDGEVKGSIKGALNRLLYGKYASEKRKGVKESTEYTIGPGGATLPVDKAEYGGVIGRFKQGFDKVREFLFGRDDEFDEDAYNANLYSKKRWKQVTGELGKAMPSMVTRGGAGMLAGLFLPGGPLLGAIVGSTSGLLKSSESLKKFLFGEELEEEHVDPVTGKVTKRKSRKGNLISKEVYDGFSKFAPNVTKGTLIGSIAGGLGLLPLGLGSTAGMLIGSIGGMITSSDQLREMIFGNVTDPKSGLISKEFRDKAKDQIKKAAPATIAGALAGGGAWNMISSMGLIPGLSLLPGGPIFTMLGGITGATNAESINKFFFGEEREETTEEDDGKGGKKKVTRKVRRGGMFGKIFDTVQNKMIKPFAKRIDETGKKIGGWFKDQIIKPFDYALKPMKDQLGKAGNAIKDSFRNIGTKITDNIKEVFHMEVGKPLGETFREKFLKPLDQISSKIFGAIGKVIGSIISAPFKALELMFAGTIGGKTLAQRKQERKDARRAKRAAKKANPWWKRKKRGKGTSTSSDTRDLRDDFMLDPNGNIIYLDDDGNQSTVSDFSDVVAMSDANQDRFYETLMQYRDNSSMGVQLESMLNRIGVSSDNIPGDTPDEKMNAMIGILRGNIMHQRDIRNRSNFYRDMGFDRGNGAATPVKSDMLALPAPSGKTTPQTAADIEAQSLGYASAAERQRMEQQRRNIIAADPRSGTVNAEKKAKKKKSGFASASDPDSSTGDVVVDAAIKQEREEAKIEAEKREEKKKESGKKTRKSDNEYLKSISKSSESILSEIKGQLGGLGWNVAYIKTLLEIVFNRKLDDSELPEEMEGSTKNVRKHRGFFGKVRDRVGEMFGGARDKVHGFMDKFFHPLRKLRDIAAGVADGLATMAGGIKDFAGNILGVAWKGLKTGGRALKTVAKGAIVGTAKAAKGVLGFIGEHLWRFGGILKEGVKALAANVAGLVQTAFEIAPVIASKLWSGGKFVLSKMLGGVKFVGKGIVGGARMLKSGVTGLFGKIFHRGKKQDTPEGMSEEKGFFEKFFYHFKKERMNVVVTGGSLDKVKEPTRIDLDSKGFKAITPFPYVHVVKGKAARRQSNIAIPVYITGADRYALLYTNDVGGQRDNVDNYMTKYNEVDRAAERAGHRAPEIYDRALQRAETPDEVRAILDAQQLNANNGMLALPGSKGLSGESSGESGNGGLDAGSALLLSSVLGGAKGAFGKLFSTFGGIGKSFAAGAPTIGKAASWLAKGLALVPGIVAFGASMDPNNPNANPVQGTHGLYKSITEDVMKPNGFIHQITNVVKNKFGKNVHIPLNMWDDAAKSASRVKPTGRLGRLFQKGAYKFGSAIENGISWAKKQVTHLVNSFLDLDIVKKNFGSMKNALSTLKSKLGAFMSSTVIGKAVSNAGKNAFESAARLGAWALGPGKFVVLAGWVALDFTAGWQRTRDYFDIMTSAETTFSMHLTSAICSVLSGLMNEIPHIGPLISAAVNIVMDEIVQLVYGILADEESKALVAKEQTMANDAKDKYNAKTGSTLNTEEFVSTKLITGDNRANFWEKTWNVLGNTFGALLPSEGGTKDVAWLRYIYKTNTPAEIREKYGDDIAREIANVLPIGEDDKRVLTSENDMLVKPSDYGEVSTSETRARDLLAKAEFYAAHAPKQYPPGYSHLVKTYYVKDRYTGKYVYDSRGKRIIHHQKASRGLNYMTGTDYLAQAKSEARERFGDSYTDAQVDQILDEMLASIGYTNGIEGPIDKTVKTREFYEKNTQRYTYGTGSVTAMNQKSRIFNRFNNNMSLAGCGPTAASMVASAYGAKLDPRSMSDLSYRLGMRAPDGGMNPEFFGQMSGILGSGFGMKVGPNDANAVYNNVKHGRPVVMMGRGGPFGNHMHYLVADGAVGTGRISYVDPLGGSRRSASISDLVGNTKSTVYSWGTGPNEPGLMDKVGGTVAAAAQHADPGNIKMAQNAVVGYMKWLQANPINYSLKSDQQDPDKGAASCASTVGWAYRKALGITGMSAGTATQSKDKRFTDIIRTGPPGRPGGKTFDLSLLQPGDLVYMYNTFPSGGGSNHTEMYIGNGKDLSHGGPGWNDRGPVERTLNEERQKRVFAVRRLNEFLGDGFEGTINTASGGHVSTGGLTEMVNNVSGWLGNTKLGKALNAASAIHNQVSSVFDKALNAVSSALGFGALVENGSSDGTMAGITSGDMSGGVVTGNTSKATKTNMKSTIWEHLLQRGYSKIAASGLMGCWEKESGNQPSRVEGDYLGSFPGVEAATASNDALNNYTTGVLFPAYARSGIGINKKAYVASAEDQNYYPGLGLAQWTGPRGYNLFSYAKKVGKPWNDIDTQLGFFDSEASADFKSKINSTTNTYDATKFVLDHYEMYPGFSNTSLGKSTLSQRSAAASSIYNAYGAGPGFGYGTGPSDANIEAMRSRIRKLNLDFSTARSIDSTVGAASGIARNIAAEGLSAEAGKTNSILETIAASIATMVELLIDIKTNTAQSNVNLDAIKGKYDSIPQAMERDETSYRTGAMVIDRLTAK